MSHIYTYKYGTTLHEIETWARETIRKAEQWNACTVQYDSGPVKCRLIPVAMVKSNDYSPWYPVEPMPDWAYVKAELDRAELIHDPNRKSVPGYHRILHIVV